jgi:hypothetical protein
MPQKVCRKCGEPGIFRKIKRDGRFHCRLGVCNACIAEYARQWRKRRTARQLDRHRAYMQRYRVKYRKAHPSRVDGTRAHAKRFPERRLYKSMLGRWRKIKPFTARLTFAEFLAEIGGKIPQRCPILGIELVAGRSPFADNSASVDRIDNRKNYQKGNIAVISWKANAMKRDGTADEHRRIARWMDKMAERRR